MGHRDVAGGSEEETMRGWTSRWLRVGAAVLSLGIAAPTAASAIEDEGGYIGVYEGGVSDDWFYDTYEVGGGLYDGAGLYDFGDYGMLEYSGVYDDNDDDDWFFDSYADPGDGGFWDI
jgi:hypothetical protein